MDPAEKIQAEKNAFAASQNPPIEACNNKSCRFTGCTCGGRCGCGMPEKVSSGELQSCDPCVEFKKKKSQEK